MGKTQKMISIQAVHKVWHLIVGGIETLDYQSDAQLQKVFTDLIVKWIPQFRLVCVVIYFNFFNYKHKYTYICIALLCMLFRCQCKKSFQSHSYRLPKIAGKQHFNLFWRKWLAIFYRLKDVKRIKMPRSRLTL